MWIVYIPVFIHKPNRYALGDSKSTASDGSDHEELQDCSETEHSSNEEDTEDKEAIADTRVLKLLYKGFFFYEDIGSSLQRFQVCTPNFGYYNWNQDVSFTEMRKHAIERLV